MHSFAEIDGISFFIATANYVVTRRVQCSKNARWINYTPKNDVVIKLDTYVRFVKFAMENMITLSLSFPAWSKVDFFNKTPWPLSLMFLINLD